MNYPVKLELRIDWSELDLFGHVNNVAFLKYVQASRINYWETIGVTKLFDEKKMAPCLYLQLVNSGNNYTIQEL